MQILESTTVLRNIAQEYSDTPQTTQLETNVTSNRLSTQQTPNSAMLLGEKWPRSICKTKGLLRVNEHLLKNSMSAS